MPSGFGHRHLHPPSNPDSARLHPQVKSCLVDINDVGVALLHQDPCHLLAELLLLLQEYGFTFLLRDIGGLGFAEGGPMFQVDLPYEPRGKFLKAQLLSPVLGPGLKRQVPL